MRQDWFTVSNIGDRQRPLNSHPLDTPRAPLQSSVLSPPIRTRSCRNITDPWRYTQVFNRAFSSCRHYRDPSATEPVSFLQSASASFTCWCVFFGKCLWMVSTSQGCSETRSQSCGPRMFGLSAIIIDPERYAGRCRGFSPNCNSYSRHKRGCLIVFQLR